MRQEGNLLYGRGAVDAKGPLATCIAAASALEDVPGRVVVIGAVEEEAATSRGARYVLDRYQPDFVVIAEPSAWDRITIGYKGRLLAHYEVTHAMAHTAGDRQSACERAVEFWQSVQRAVDVVNEDRPVGAFERLQSSLRAMCSASDGLSETAELELGFRLPPGFDLASWELRLRALADGAELRLHGREQAVRVEKNTALTRAFLAAIRQEGGVPRFTVKTGTSDMNVVAEQWRCPMVAYGPGDAALDHTPNEHIVVDDYYRAIRVLSAMLQSLLVEATAMSMLQEQLLTRKG